MIHSSRCIAAFVAIVTLLSHASIFSQVSFKRHDVSTGLQGAYWVHVDDIDNDGRRDLVTASYDGIDWWQGNGSGGFSKRHLGPLTGAWACFAADINGDGRLDIIGGSPAIPEVAWWQNNGGTSFSSKRTIDATTNSPESVAGADFDGDGDGDIVVAMWGAGQLLWYEYRGGNDFTTHVLDGDMSGAHSVYVGDFNRDGRPDIVGSGSGKTRVYTNTGNGNFSRANLGSQGSLGVYVYDVDEDGRPDVVRSQRDNGDIDWFRNTGSGFSEILVGSGFGDSWSVSAGDIDGDGDVDIVAAGFAANNITAWLNDGNNNFGNGVIVDNVGKPRSVFVARLDADGDLDIAAAIREDQDLAWYEVTGGAPPQSLTLTAPNGGEDLTAGETYNIRWNSTGSISSVDLEFSSNDGNNWSDIVKGTNNDGSYSWNVPNTSSSQCLVRVSDASDGSPTDRSNNTFSIEIPVPTITVTSPDGGETFIAGTSHQIRWNSTGEVSAVDIEFSSNGGGDWSVVADETDDDGSFSWTVPSLNSEDCLIRILSSSDHDVQDQSNSTFEIEIPQPTIVVTAPDGGETLDAGSNYTITWTTGGAVGEVAIDFSSDGGSSWASVVTSTSNDGTYQWTVPNLNSGNCLVRISDVSGAASDVSDDEFSIVIPAITVLGPNGGEALSAAAAYEITWSSVGQIGDVDIEFSSDNGTTWISVITGTSNDGEFSWTVPIVDANECLIRISEEAGDISDISDNVFVIAIPPESIAVTAPNGGENLAAGESFTIRWSSGGLIERVTIEFSANGGTDWSSLSQSTNNDGAYSWTVPNLSATNCVIRVSDASDGSPVDASDDYFAILLPDPEITVLSPNGGEQFAANASHVISWTTVGNVQTVLIDFSSDGGENWTGVISTENDGTYTWTVPDINSSQCLIRISDSVDGGVNDVSDGAFLIATSATSIQVMRPNGGEMFGPDSTVRIHWESTGAIETVDISFSDNNGASWGVIRNSTNNDGGYDWAVPFIDSDQCLIRVSDSNGPASDISDSTFRVYTNLPALPEVTSFSPERGNSGMTVRVVGNNLLNAIGVWFGTLAADFEVLSDEEIDCTVPLGAENSKIRVVTPAGEAVSVSEFIVNIAPVAADDSISVPEDSSAVFDLLANDSDADGEVSKTSVLFVSEPGFGEAVFDSSTGLVTYLPAPDFFGADSFSYVVRDNENLLSNRAVVQLTVTPVNDAPVATPDTVVTTEGQAVTFDPRLNDSDIDDPADLLKLDVLTPFSAGITEFDSASGVLTYIPESDFSGRDSLRYQLQDSSGALSNVASVHVWVQGVNDAPVIKSYTPAEQVLSFEEADTVAFAITVKDADGDSLIYSWQLNDRLVSEGPGFLFVAANYSAQDFTISVRVTDGIAADSVSWTISIVTSIAGAGKVPQKFAVSQNYPNPFNPRTRIDFALPAAEHVSISVYDLLGRKVKTLVDGPLGPGNHSVHWNATDATGLKMSSGVYFYHVTAGPHVFVGKMLLVQ